MPQALTLVTRRPFGALTCNFYQNDAHEFYMTREQIGQALEYPAGGRAIAQIHHRNADRLNVLSRVTEMKTPGGKQKVHVYTLRGVMEICRFSHQPKANAFMDFIWNIVLSLYSGSAVLASPSQQTAVSQQTMQLLVDSLLKAQNETLRCMSAITQAFAAGVPAPAVSVPVSQSAPAIPAQGNASSLVPGVSPARHRSSTSPWRQNVYDTIAKIIANRPDLYKDPDSVRYKIYEKLKRDYGWVYAQEKRNYLAAHPNLAGTKIYPLTVIEDNATYAEIFMSILNDLYNSSIISCVRQADTARAPTSAGSPSSVPAASIARLARAQVKQNEILASSLVQQVAQHRGDKSYRSSWSWYAVYQAMDQDWDKIQSEYAQAFGKKVLTRKQMVVSSAALMQKFTQAAQSLLS